VERAELSERMVVAIDQYAALSAATPTRRPVETRSWALSRAMLVAVSDRNAVIAAVLVLILAM
jgi:hypothetical protein